MTNMTTRLMATVLTLAAMSAVLWAAHGSLVPVKPIRAGVISPGGEKDNFMRRVYEAQVKRAVDAGRKPFPGLREDQLEVVEGRHEMSKDAAEQCKLLLKQARSDLRRRKEEGSREALKVSDIAVYSAYRSVERDAAGWHNAFKKHLKATKNERAALVGGEYGDKAVDMMVTIMRKFKAPPGFSKHTSGVAVDFRTVEDNVTLTANSSKNGLWKKTWFHKWLVKNAGRFKFKPLATEAWHWEHTK